MSHPELLRCEQKRLLKKSCIVKKTVSGLSGGINIANFGLIVSTDVEQLISFTTFRKVWESIPSIRQF